MPQLQTAEPCKFWKLGKCTRGYNCPDLHLGRDFGSRANAELKAKEDAAASVARENWFQERAAAGQNGSQKGTTKSAGKGGKNGG